MRVTSPLVRRLSLGLFVAIAFAGPAPDAAPEGYWAHAIEDDRSIKIETCQLEAVIPKKDPKHWMTGIETGSFLDKATGFHEIGDGLMVVD